VINGTTVNYKYDGLGRRVEREVISVGTTVTRYIYDNEDILLELDGSNNIVGRYTHGPGIDEPLIVERSAGSFFYHADGLGSITELTNQSGTVVQRYAYSSFGKIESQLDPNFVQPYTFTSREFDAETALYYYRARYYDPEHGRFTSEDPMELAGGDINFYVYARNSSPNRSDPFGRCPVCLVGLGAIDSGVAAGMIAGGISIGILAGGAIYDLAGQLYDYLAGDQSDRSSKPPPGSKGIDETEWSGDHREIKDGVGARPRDNVKIDPSGNVWRENPDGTWTNAGPAEDYVRSGKPSGRRGQDRERNRSKNRGRGEC
jgi:RHS repeat-associated protein